MESLIEQANNLSLNEYANIDLFDRLFMEFIYQNNHNINHQLNDGDSVATTIDLNHNYMDYDDDIQ